MLNKKNAVVVLTLFGTVLLNSGCGKSPTGTYNTTQTLSGGAMSSSCANSQIPLAISESNSAVTGTGSSACFSSETISGTDSGSGQVTGATLTFTLAAQTGSNSQYGYGNSQYPYQQQGSGQSCSYTGSLTLSGNQLTGTLNLQTTQTQNQSSYMSASCPNTVTLNGTDAT